MKRKAAFHQSCPAIKKSFWKNYPWKYQPVLSAQGACVYLPGTSNQDRHSCPSQTHPTVTLWVPPLLVSDVSETLCIGSTCLFPPKCSVLLHPTYWQHNPTITHTLCQGDNSLQGSRCFLARSEQLWKQVAHQRHCLNLCRSLLKAGYLCTEISAASPTN